MILGPSLTTDRLTLRPPLARDFDALCAFGWSKERMRFLGGVANENATWRTFLADIGHWALRGYGFFSIEVSDTACFVGRAGPIFHRHNTEPELAWHLFEGCEHHGYASEAAAAARDWHYAHTGNDPLMSWISRDNLSSQAVARRLGATQERLDKTASGHEGHIWRHQKP